MLLNLCCNFCWLLMCTLINFVVIQTDKTKSKRVLTTPPRIIETPAIDEDEEDELDEVILRPRQLQLATSSENIWPTKLVNKNLKNLHLDAPYFTQRPASENDIATIFTPTPKPNVSSTTEVNRFSMTPEVPSISFAHLPKNYLETPTIDKYKKEAPSLLEIQTSEIRKSMIDFSMPRYYGKSDMILNRSFDAVGSTSSIASTGSASSTHKKQHEKSKRLKNFRTHLPPLSIHSKDKPEKEKWKSDEKRPFLILKTSTKQYFKTISHKNLITFSKNKKNGVGTFSSLIKLKDHKNGFCWVRSRSSATFSCAHLQVVAVHITNTSLTSIYIQLSLVVAHISRKFPACLLFSSFVMW